MNKKQKNRKLVSQNKRNRMINRRYSSTVKNLLKLLKVKSKLYSAIDNVEEKSGLKNEITQLTNSCFSILDKAVKKNVIHKNNASRKKSKISRILV
jgi:small subunit ribosomal protein S20